MAFALRASHPMADMNITPLVDVMLVMLVIFMITMPALTQTLPLRIGTSEVQPPVPPPEAIRLHLDASGLVSWNGAPLGLAEVRTRLAAAAAPGFVSGGVDAARQPTVEIDADDAAPYDAVARVMASADFAGLQKISLVAPSQPGPGR